MTCKIRKILFLTENLGPGLSNDCLQRIKVSFINKRKLNHLLSLENPVTECKHKNMPKPQHNFILADYKS